MNYINHKIFAKYNNVLNEPNIDKRIEYLLQIITCLELRVNELDNFIKRNNLKRY